MSGCYVGSFGERMREYPKTLGRGGPKPVRWHRVKRHIVGRYRPGRGSLRDAGGPWLYVQTTGTYRERKAIKDTLGFASMEIEAADVDPTGLKLAFERNNRRFFFEAKL